MLPSLARNTRELIGSNGASSTVESLGTLIGPLLAGVLVSVADVGVVFAVGAGAMLAAAIFFSLVRVEGRLRVAPAPGTKSTRALLIAGIEFLARAPGPRMVVGLIAAQAFVRGCLNVLIVVAAFQVLDADESAIGYMTAAIGVGGLLGALGAFTLGGRRLAVVFGVALVFWGLPIGRRAPSSFLVTARVLLAVGGAANSIGTSPRSRCSSGSFPMTCWPRLRRHLGLAMGVATRLDLCSAVVSLFGAQAALVVVGLILPVLALLAWSRLAAIDRARPAKRPAGDDRPRSDVCAVVLAAKEQLATALVPMSVSAGDAVIRANDSGEHFYIVVDGEFEILAGDARLAAHAGDHFGEIALLRDVPRTATVKALVDSQVYALERADFLAAVTGHSDVRAAGEDVATERLARGSGSPSPARSDSG